MEQLPVGTVLGLSNPFFESEHEWKVKIIEGGYVQHLTPCFLKQVVPIQQMNKTESLYRIVELPEPKKDKPIDWI